jgi:DNA-binding PucR family transcriptional regulator
MNEGDTENKGRQEDHLAPLLEVLKNDPGKAAYYLGLLRPLQEYDRAHYGDLVKTLAAYLRHGGNSTQTADALFMHRNSLRYRLARIRAISGMDLDDPDTRLALQVAVLLLHQQ